MKYLFDENKFGEVYRGCNFTFEDMKDFIQSEIKRNVKESLERMRIEHYGISLFKDSEICVGYNQCAEMLETKILVELSRLEDKP